MAAKKNLTPAQKKKRAKRIIYIAVTVVLALVIIGFTLPKKSKSGELAALPVKKEKSRNQIEVSGYIEAAHQQALEAPGEGIVQIVNVKEGDVVKKGQLIFSLDTTQQLYSLASQEFAINQEKINGASQKLKLMQQQYAMLKKQLEDRRVVALFDGIIASLKVSQGEYAKVKDSFGMLIDRSYLKASVEIAEADASRLKVGQKVNLKFPAEPELSVEGFVTSYPAIARVTGMGRTVVDANIRIDNPPDRILPGYSFNGTIIAGEDTEILVLSQNGVRYVEGKPFADKITDGGTTEERALTVEPYVTGFVKIISGLQDGDTVKDQTGGGDLSQQSGRR